MTINTAAGSKIYIGTTLAINLAQADNLVIAAFAADTYHEIGEVEDLGEFGDEATEVTFTSLGDRRVRKLKGSLNAGTMTVTVGDDPSDTGQNNARDAFNSQLDFNFKVQLNDQITISGEPTTMYYRGKVMTKRRNVGSVDNVVRRSFNVGINTAIYEVSAS